MQFCQSEFRRKTIQKNTADDRLLSYFCNLFIIVYIKYDLLHAQRHAFAFQQRSGGHKFRYSAFCHNAADPMDLRRNGYTYQFITRTRLFDCPDGDDDFQHLHFPHILADDSIPKLKNYQQSDHDLSPVMASGGIGRRNISVFCIEKIS